MHRVLAWNCIYSVVTCKLIRRDSTWPTQSSAKENYSAMSLSARSARVLNWRRSARIVNLVTLHSGQDVFTHGNNIRTSGKLRGSGAPTYTQGVISLRNNLQKRNNLFRFGEQPLQVKQLRASTCAIHAHHAAQKSINQSKPIIVIHDFCYDQSLHLTHFCLICFLVDRFEQTGVSIKKIWPISGFYLIFVWGFVSFW